VVTPSLSLRVPVNRHDLVRAVVKRLKEADDAGIQTFGDVLARLLDDDRPPAGLQERLEAIELRLTAFEAVGIGQPIVSADADSDGIEASATTSAEAPMGPAAPVPVAEPMKADDFRRRVQAARQARARSPQRSKTNPIPGSYWPPATLCGRPPLRPFSRAAAAFARERA
jgi:hypothetical protein